MGRKTFPLPPEIRNASRLPGSIKYASHYTTYGHVSKVFVLNLRFWRLKLTCIQKYIMSIRYKLKVLTKIMIFFLMLFCKVHKQ